MLDLLDSLLGDVEPPGNLVECLRVLAAEPVPKLEHAALAVAETRQRVSQGLVGEDLHGALVGRRGMFVGDQLAQLGSPLFRDRLFERDRRLSGPLDVVDLLEIDPGRLSDFLGCWFAAERRDQATLGIVDLVELLDDMDRDPDRTRLVRDSDRRALNEP